MKILLIGLVGLGLVGNVSAEEVDVNVDDVVPQVVVHCDQSPCKVNLIIHDIGKCMDGVASAAAALQGTSKSHEAPWIAQLGIIACVNKEVPHDIFRHFD